MLLDMQGGMFTVKQPWGGWQSHDHVTIQGSVNNGSVHEFFDFVGEMVASVCGLLLRSGIRRFA